MAVNLRQIDNDSNVQAPRSTEGLSKLTGNRGSRVAPTQPKSRPPVPYTPTPAPTPTTYGDSGSNYDGGGGDPGTLFDSGQNQADSEMDYLSGDGSYQAQLAALIRAASDYDTDVTSQKTKYDVDYGDALKNLGFIQDDPGTADANESKWNFGDLNTAAGRSFQNQRNDFAGRGMLQSSLYGTANDNLTRSLNDQLGSVNNAKQSFFDDISRQQGSYKTENTLAQQQARASALDRRAAGIF
jgi:hypothetical protein